MIPLILGVVLWWAAHLYKRLGPTRGLPSPHPARERGMVSLALVVAVGLMVWGFRSAEFVPVYDPLPGIGHLNNLLMLVSVFLFGVGGTKGTLYPKIRHPMLWGTVVWAVAHLLVNGDSASLVLFGGIGLWALVEMAVINRAQTWVPPAPVRGIKGDAMNLAGTLILYGIIAGVHIWTGHNPFLGTYG